MALDLQAPIGVFDAGIGSYAMVELIRRHYPRQDILYFADRASFPYGTKSKAELAASVGSAVSRLADMGAVAVVLASNAPSVMVLGPIADAQPVPVMGIYPPVAEAVRRSRSGRVAVLGVQSLIASAEIRAFVDREAGGRQVALVNASALVERVEDGSFLSDPQATQVAVTAFMAGLRQDFPGLDTCTLSSTHLPWLTTFFQAAAPEMLFLDPAESLVPRLLPYIREGSGRTACIATGSAAYPVAGLEAMLRLLGVDLVVHAVPVVPVVPVVPAVPAVPGMTAAVVPREEGNA